MSRVIIYFLIVSLMCFSCSKKVAKHIAGTYDGYAYFQQYQNGAGNNSNETIYGEFSVVRNGRYLVIMGNKIHRNDLADGYHSFTNGDCNSYVSFHNDTIEAYFCEYYNQAAYKFSGCWGVKK